MNILLTNDDGIFAPGLLALYRRLSGRHTVTVVAPDRERSAVGHGITLHEPLRAAPIPMPGNGRGYAVNGTPADCIKLSVLEILSTPPDVVISGINPGANIGVNTHYSGTVAAAREAALLSLMSIAVSINSFKPEHYEGAAEFTENFAMKILSEGLPEGVFLNVNIPDRPLQCIRGVCISRQGSAVSRQGFEKRVDPRNRPYYWQGIDAPERFAEDDMDGAALKEEAISVTPMRCDMTDYDFMNTLLSWDIILSENMKGTAQNTPPECTAFIHDSHSPIK